MPSTANCLTSNIAIKPILMPVCLKQSQTNSHFGQDAMLSEKMLLHMLSDKINLTTV